MVIVHKVDEYSSIFFYSNLFLNQLPNLYFMNKKNNAIVDIKYHPKYINVKKFGKKSTKVV